MACTDSHIEEIARRISERAVDHTGGQEVQYF